MQVGERVGPFDIEKKIGAGAMGAVYLARYRKTGQRVAIKMMLMGLADNDVSLARFEREAEVLKQLSHKNIVRFFVVSRHQGTPYYAMEFIEGEALDESLQRKGRLTWEEVVELGKEVCAALQHAHDQGIIHRDLKPSNLMVTPDGTVKLTDFGIAKDLDVTQLTSVNCTVGTAAYMSPEQCRGERNLTHKSDLYSLGVMLYELLTGHKPFEAETTMDMFLQHVQGTFERPSRQVLDIPVWLDTLVCQLLEKEPAKRPYDASTVSDALSQVAEKVQAQRSAGVDVARARIADRETLRNASLDKTDKQAARTLRASAQRGKRKRRGTPLYQRNWFQAIGLSLALAGIGAMIYLVLRPPSAETLHRQAKEFMVVKEWQKALDGPIARYRRYYGAPDNEQTKLMTAEIKEWEKKSHIALKGEQLGKLLQNSRIVGSEAGVQAVRAVEKEHSGDWGAALQCWSRCLNAALSEGDHAWKDFAELQKQQYEGREDSEARLKERVKVLIDTGEYIASPGDQIEGINALRFEALGDRDRAREYWLAVKSKNQTWYRNVDDDQWRRFWYLEAVKKAADLDATLKGKKEDEIKTERQKLIDEKLKSVEADLAQTPPPNLRIDQSVLREIAHLYMNDDSDPKLKPMARKAADLLRKHTPTAQVPDTAEPGKTP